MAATDELIATVADGVGVITLNRPDQLNAVTAAMAERLADIAQDFELDPGVRCVLIRGEGRAFCAGGDVKSFHAQLIADQQGYARAMERTVTTGHLAFTRFRRMPKPVVVVVHGATAGLGISLMCCADLVVAAEDTRFSLAYRHVGLALDGGVSFFLPRIVGERRALQIALLGESFGVDRAVEWGMVNRTAPPVDVQDEALKLARSLAAGPTLALGQIKQLLRQSLQSSWDEQSAAEALALSTTIASADHLEGTTAFVEKRRPAFTGA